MRTRRTRLVAWLITVSALAVNATAGTSNWYIEDFSTDTYKDPLNTTVEWNTAAGELQLEPFSPSIVGNFATPLVGFTGVAIDGNRAFMCNQYLGLRILDITNPANPYLLGTWAQTGYDPLRVEVRGDVAYAVTGDYFVAIDISNPVAPSLVGEYVFPHDRAFELAIDGRTAFVSCGQQGVFILDISDPSSISFLAQEDSIPYASDVAVSGNRAYVAGSNGNGVWTYDITDPRNPLVLSIFTTVGGPRGVAVDGDYLYVAHGSLGLSVMDITNPTAPVLLGTSDTPDNALKVAVSGDWAYVVDMAGGLRVFDVRQPASPNEHAFVNTPGIAKDVVLSGEHAFVADGDGGLQVIRVAEREPQVVASHPLIPPGWSVHVDMAGNFGILGGCFNGIHTLDITDPANPVIVATLDTPNCAKQIDIEGNLAFIADQFAGLRVADISDPYNASLVGGLNPGLVQKVIVEGDLAYLVLQNEFYILDASNPYTPPPLSVYSVGNPLFDIALHGNYILASVGETGIETVDVSDPTNPVSAGVLPMSGATTLVPAGDYAFFARRNLGLTVLDISDPTALTVVANIAADVSAGNLAIDGNLLFVGDGASLRVFDVSAPAAPIEIDSHALANAPGTWPPTIFGDHIYVPNHPTSGPDPGAVEIFRFNNRFFEVGSNVATSTLVAATPDTIRALRFATTEGDSIRWEASPNGIGDWQHIATDGRWHPAGSFGTSLYWRSTHTAVDQATNPNCSSLQIDWLYEAPYITSVADAPSDQGGFVVLSWARSGLRFVNGDSVTAYEVYRPEAQAATGATISKPISSAPPPTGWTLSVALPADDRDAYQLFFPTAADSSPISVPMNAFLVRAATSSPSVYLDSQPDSGYSVDNLAPAPPASVSAVYSSGSGNSVFWTPSVDSDVIFYRVYRSTDPDFDPTSQTLVHITEGATWVDAVPDGWEYTYKVSAVDQSLQEGAAQSSGPATAITPKPRRREFALEQNIPNPFNPTTAIRYSIGASGVLVELSVFDVDGRLVRRLVDTTQPVGRYSVPWDGTNDRGQPVASGVYFYRLTAGSFVETRKMSLIK